MILKIPGFHKADQWITRIVSYPGIDKDALAQKKIYWIASVAVTCMIFCLTMAYHFIFPQLRILIYYGLFLTLVFLQGVIYPVIFRRLEVWHRFIDQFLVAIATFIAILKLGGIPYSGGLVFVGLALVFFSLNFWKRNATIAIYIVYVITVILAGILHPYLTVPPEMTPAVNISLYVINLLWISGFATVFVLGFISQRVKMEKAEAQRLKELDEAKSRLYANITHEFRTPLTVITGMTKLIREDPERWLEEGVEKIDRNAGILLHLVNQMLELTRLEAGAMTVTMVRGDVNQYIKYIVELFESLAAEKQIGMHYNPCEQDTVIDHDPEKLMQVLSNLLSNALKFTQPSGMVEVRTVLTGDDRFEIHVKDNGPGIHKEDLPRIFDRFYRAEESGGQSLPGSGLGLTLTKELVKLLKGSIEVESEYGKGTAFIVSLPATRTAAMKEAQDLNELQGKIFTYMPQGSRRVRLPSEREPSGDIPLLLIVEDNPDVIQYLVTLVGKEYDVVTACDGREGVETVLACIPDIILSDVMMPVMDGIEMLDRIKNDFRTSHIPVVMLTAKADVSSRLEGLERGADAYIAKPFDAQELLVQMRSLVELRKKLRKRYAAVADLNLPADNDLQKEDAFIRQIRDIMFSNLDDDRFEIRRLCSEMGMSRSQLYRKFKFLTDRTITEYMRSLRLHKARDLLVHSDLTVSEAAYRTGFKNISHFSKVFTREFDVNPSDLRKS
jgi:signal transduction histidine kinase/DNA-binding response OmpR family regulator